MKKRQITFSDRYTKLNKDRHTTVRWLDAEYSLGKVYEEILIQKKGGFYSRINLSEVRITKIEIATLRSLSDAFTLQDADCNKLGFMQMMEKWYSRKKDWKGEDSEIQILYLEKTEKSNPAQRTT